MPYRSEFYLGDRNPHVDETEVSWMEPFKEIWDQSVTKGVVDLATPYVSEGYDKVTDTLGAISEPVKTFGGLVVDEAKELGNWRGWAGAAKEATRPMWTAADTLLGMGSGMLTMGTAGVAGSGAALATGDISNFGPVVDKVLNEMPTYHPQSEGGQEILKGISDVVFGIAVGAGEGVQWAADKSGAPPRIAQTAGAITSALIAAATVGVPALRVRGRQVPTEMVTQWSSETFAAGRKDITATINNPVFIARVWNYLDPEAYALAVKNNTLWTDIPMIQKALSKNLRGVVHEMKWQAEEGQVYGTARRGGDPVQRPWVQHIIENIKNLETSLNRPYETPTATITTYTKTIELSGQKTSTMGHEWGHVLDYFLYDLMGKTSKTAMENAQLVPDFKGNIRPLQHKGSGLDTASARIPSLVEFSYEAASAYALNKIKSERRNRGEDYVPEGKTLDSWREGLIREGLDIRKTTEILARVHSLNRFIKENPELSLNDLVKEDIGKLDVRSADIPSDVTQLLKMMTDMVKESNIPRGRVIEMLEAMLDDVRMTYPKKYNVEFYLGESPPVKWDFIEHGRNFGNKSDHLLLVEEAARKERTRIKSIRDQQDRDLRADIYERKTTPDYTIDPTIRDFGYTPKL